MSDSPPTRRAAHSPPRAWPLTVAPDYSSLDPCVHCGFCLPACPTYLATGDEADSPRGRIVLMRALERGDIPATDPALVQHLDACLGCLGCEPVCPSGVGYGRGIQTAREQLFARRPLPPLARAVLGVFRHDRVWRPLFSLARLFRSTSLPWRLAGAGRVGFGLGMVAATEPWSEQADTARPRGGTESRTGTAAASRERQEAPEGGPTVALFRGCVMDTLFRHVHEATRRTLEANGYRVIEPQGQVCCGALHEHAGDRAAAEALARRNVAALADAADFVVVNSAGCGALLKGYDHLLGGDGGHAGMGGPMHGRPGPESVRAGRAPDQTDDLDVPSPVHPEGGTAALAARLAAKVRDVAELLAERGPRPGAALPLDVAYDAPCHLQHAQRVHAAPLAVLAAIPGLRLQLRPSSDKCCGSAGIYSVLRPAMARAVLDLKIEDLAAAEPRPAVVATGNPGCLMQIGAGLRAAGLPIRVAHPVELLDESYRRAGLYPDGDDATVEIPRGESAGAPRP